MNQTLTLELLSYDPMSDVALVAVKRAADLTVAEITFDDDDVSMRATDSLRDALGVSSLALLTAATRALSDAFKPEHETYADLLEKPIAFELV